MFTIASAFFLSIANIFTRKAILFSGSESSLFSYLFGLVAMLCIKLYKRENPLGPKGHRYLVFIRAFFIVFALITIKTAVRLISPSDATAIFHINVIVVAILARILFKEILSFIHIFCVFIALTGTYSYIFQIILT